MYSKIMSCGLLGIDGFIVEVETDIGNGIPSFDIVGLGDTAIREAKERVRSAVKNSGFDFPIRRITMNLAPANLRKEGSTFDLSIALGILASTGVIDHTVVRQSVFIGELSLDGQIKAVTGALPIAICARQNNMKYLFLPEANAKEASVVKEIKVIAVKNLKEAVEAINGEREIIPIKAAEDYLQPEYIKYDTFCRCEGTGKCKKGA